MVRVGDQNFKSDNFGECVVISMVPMMWALLIRH